MATHRIATRIDTGDGREAPGSVEVEVRDGAVVSAGGGAAVAVRNESGGTLAADSLVYVSGWSDTHQLPLISKADANVANAQAMFVLPTAILNGGNGLAYTAALSAATLNTDAAASAGDPVYLSETAGGWTVTAPTAAGSNVQIVGHVVVKSATVGQIRFQIGDKPTVTTDDIQDLAVTTGKLASGAVTEAKLEAGAAGAGITGTALKFVADQNVIGGVPVLHRYAIADQASGNIDIALTHKTKIVDAWIVKGAAGHASEDTIKLQNVTTDITGALAMADAANALKRFATIDEAQSTIAAGANLRAVIVRGSGGGNNTACSLYVLAVRVA